MNPTKYFNLVWKTNKSMIIFSMIALAGMQLLILNLVTTFDTQAIMDSILEQLPKNMKVFLSESFFSTLNLDGAAAFGYNHPMVIALIVVIAINIPVRHISHELESGTLELLLSHPVKRSDFINVLFTTGLILLFFIVASAFAGSILGIVLFHEINSSIVVSLIKISLNMWHFSILIFSLTMAIASKTKGGGFSGNLSAMIVFAFYLTLIISQLWDKMEFTQTFNIFYYYEPQKIMLGQGHFILDTVVLLSASAICLAFSLYHFSKRDIP